MHCDQFLSDFFFPFQKRFLLGQGAGQTLYTQKEFDESLAQAKAEIMAIAIETTKKAIFIERQECANVVRALADEEDEGETCTALKNAAEARKIDWLDLAPVAKVSPVDGIHFDAENQIAIGKAISTKLQTMIG
mgnify:CR=1 FL=1